MTVSTSLNRITYTGNGSNTVFGYPYKFLAITDIRVYVNNVLQVLTTNYSVGAPSDAGANITFVVAPASTYSVVIYSDTDLLQATDLPENGKFPSTSVETMADKLTLICQRLADKVGRAFSISDGDTTTSSLFPSYLASAFIRWNATTAKLENADLTLTTATGSTIATFSLLGSQTAILGQVINTAGHTTAGIGGGQFIAKAGSVTTLSGIRINSPTAGLYWERATLDGLTIEDFGCYQSASDNSTAFQIAVDSGYTLNPCQGTYKINSAISTTSNLVLLGAGDTTIFDFSGGGSLNPKSALASLPALSTSTVAGDNVVTFASAHGLSIGNVFIIYNPTTYSFSPYRDYYYDGCMFKVSAVVSSTQVRIYGNIPNAYNSGVVANYKLTGGQVKLQDFKIIPNASAVFQIETDGHVDVTYSGITAPVGSLESCISISRCYDFRIDAKGSADQNDAYPIVIGNCQLGRATGSTNSNRHCIAFGGSGLPGCVPCRDITISDSVFYNDGVNGLGATDCHGNSENISYVNCIMKTSANFGGRNISFKGCTIYGRPIAYNADGNCVFSGEYCGGIFSMEGCRLVTYGSLLSFGAITMPIDKLTEDAIIQIKNCTIDVKSASISTGNIIVIGAGDSSPSAFKVFLDIDGLTLKSSTVANSIVVITGANDISSTLTVSIQNLIAPNQQSLVNASTVNNLNALMRLPRQTKKAVIAIAAGASTYNTGSINYRYLFPRLPALHCSMSSKDGAAQSAVLGGKTSVVFGRAFTASACTISISTTDATNYTGSDSVTVTAVAEINEL